MTLASLCRQGMEGCKFFTPIQAFTGDTLFVGSCGRPDLVGSIGYSADEMAKLMFYTLKTKLCTLPDDVQVRTAG